MPKKLDKDSFFDRYFLMIRGGVFGSVIGDLHELKPQSHNIPRRYRGTPSKGDDSALRLLLEGIHHLLPIPAKLSKRGDQSQ